MLQCVIVAISCSGLRAVGIRCKCPMHALHFGYHVPENALYTHSTRSCCFNNARVLE